MKTPRFAILFWYYKAPEICEHRVRLLRRMNADTLIFGLYGGEPNAFPAFNRALADLLDDNWAYPNEKDPEWKWRHGDRMISQWFEDRGHAFEWDSIVIMQWDMVALAPIDRLFGMLRPDELYLPGLRPLAEIELRWWWTRPGTEVYDDYLAFKQWIADRTGYTRGFQACQFVTAVLPRTFLKQYAAIEGPERGFLEYKIPAYAAALGFVARDLPHLPTTWVGESHCGRRVTLTAAKTDIPPKTLVMETLRSEGARLFHPVSYRFPSQRHVLLAWLAARYSANLVRRIAHKFGRGMRPRKNP